MTNGAPLAGLVLAGGRSSRFGGEKALATLAGKSLLARALASLEAFTPRIAVSAVAGSATEAEARALGYPVVHDPAIGARGPLVGVLAGLRLARSDAWLITLPCDVVPLASDGLDRLVRASGGVRPAYIATARGIESLCAIWPAAGLSVLETALARGNHPPVRDVLRALGAEEVLIEGEDVFFNVNTREDLAKAEKLLARDTI